MSNEKKKTYQIRVDEETKKLLDLIKQSIGASYAHAVRISVLEKFGNLIKKDNG